MQAQVLKMASIHLHPSEKTKTVPTERFCVVMEADLQGSRLAATGGGRKGIAVSYIRWPYHSNVMDILIIWIFFILQASRPRPHLGVATLYMCVCVFCKL